MTETGKQMYKLFLSVVLGCLGFVLIFFTSRLQFREVYINFPWSVILPLLVTLVWGTRYGLISISFSGLAFYPFFVGGYNGWASLVPVLTFYVWILLHGEGRRLRASYRGKLPSWVFSVYSIQLIHSLIRLLLYPTLFPLLLRLNGTFWNPQVHLQLPLSIIMLFAVKGVLVEALLVGLSQALLLLPLVRRLFLLELPRSGRYNSRIMAAMVGFGLLFTLMITASQDYIIDQISPWKRLFAFDDRMQLTVIMAAILFTLMGGVTAFFSQRFLDTQEDLLERKKELKKAVQKISGLNRNLERRVIERTAQLEAANRELQNFVSTVSHDLKSPLRAIYSCCEMIREEMGSLSPDLLPQAEAGRAGTEDGDPERESLEMVKEIEKTSGEMIGLIERLLEYATLEEAEVKSRAIDTDTMVGELIDELRRAYPEIPIHFRAEEPLPIIVSDPFLLKDIFRNLLSNGIKFSRPKGRCDLSLSVEMGLEHCTFILQDRGVGFPSEFSNKLFQIFERLHKKSDFEGHGVGLAAVKKMVGKLGGEVSIFSETGRGTRVTIILPILTEHR